MLPTCLSSLSIGKLRAILWEEWSHADQLQCKDRLLVWIIEAIEADWIVFSKSVSSSRALPHHPQPLRWSVARNTLRTGRVYKLWIGARRVNTGDWGEAALCHHHHLSLHFLLAYILLHPPTSRLPRPNPLLWAKEWRPLDHWTGGMRAVGKVGCPRCLQALAVLCIGEFHFFFWSGSSPQGTSSALQVHLDRRRAHAHTAQAAKGQG